MDDGLLKVKEAIDGVRDRWCEWLEIPRAGGCRRWVAWQCLCLAARMVDEMRGAEKPSSDVTYGYIETFAKALRDLAAENKGERTDLWYCLDDAAPMARRLRSMDDYEDEDE